MGETKDLDRSRRLLGWGALATAVGLGLGATVDASGSWSSWVVLGGWGALVYGLHAFGRRGPG